MQPGVGWTGHGHAIQCRPGAVALSRPSRDHWMRLLGGRLCAFTLQSGPSGLGEAISKITTVYVEQAESVGMELTLAVDTMKYQEKDPSSGFRV